MPSKNNSIKVGVYASGAGSNARAICQALQDAPDVEVAAVFTNNPRAGALQVAAEAGVPAHLFTPDEVSEGGAQLTVLEQYRIDFIALAGYLRLVPEEVTDAYERRIVNIHPSLLPRHGGKGFYGLMVHESVIAAREKVTGVTIHYVTAGFDEGATITQARLPVNPEWDAEQLQKRVLALEHKLYPETILKLCRHLRAEGLV